MLCAIDAFLKLEDMTLRNVETRRGFHIYFFLKISIKVGSLNVHLIYFKVAFSSKGKDSIKGREFGNGSKGLVKINTFNLYETLCDDVCFVFLYATISSTFNVENPFAAYNFATFWPRDNVVNVQVLPSLHLLFIGSKPLSSI